MSGKFDLQKNRVQIISIFILLLVIGGVFLIYSKKTSDSVEVAISPNVLDVKNGDYFKVNVLVDPDNKPVTSLQFNLIFNGSLINITNVSQGSFLKQHNAKTIFNTGKLDQDNGTLMKVWGLISTKGGNATASDNFAIIILAAKEKGISKLEFGNVVVHDFRLNKILSEPNYYTFIYHENIYLIK